MMCNGELESGSVGAPTHFYFLANSKNVNK